MFRRYVANFFLFLFFGLSSLPSPSGGGIGMSFRAITAGFFCRFASTGSAANFASALASAALVQSRASVAAAPVLSTVVVAFK